MTAGRTVTALAFAFAAPWLTTTSQQRPVFRAGTDAVVVDVSVRQGNIAVSGLLSSDFVVTDNGVRQEPEILDVDAVSIDLTLLLDTSGSVAPMMGALRSDIRETAALLRPTDRIRLITFATNVSDAFGWLPGRGDPPIDTLSAGGATSLNDAVVAALIRPRAPDRRQLIAVFTDGIDTISLTDRRTLLDVATRADALLRVFLVTNAPASGEAPLAESIDDRSGLREAARATGGQLDRVFAREHVPTGLKQALVEFRTHYVLRYTAKDVARPGWHDITVRVNRPGRYDVTARKGYVGR